MNAKYNEMAMPLPQAAGKGRRKRPPGYYEIRLVDVGAIADAKDERREVQVPHWARAYF